MKYKYKIALFITSFFLLSSVLLLCHFSIFNMEKKNVYVAVNTSGCIGVIYSDDQEIFLKNPKSYSDEDGMLTIPKTITISNTCDTSDSISLYLDIFNDSTIYDSKMKVNVNGDAYLETTNLNNTNKFIGQDNILNTYKLLNITLNSYETKRINFRMWLDYNETITKEKNKFHAKYYVISDSENNRLNFTETILKDNKIVLNDGLTRVDNSYYFKGNVSNNNVLFNDTMWKIVAINEDNSVKLIYNGDYLESKFNDKLYEEKSVNYDSSLIKDYLDKYYEDNLKSHDSIILESSYCIDTSNETTYKKVFGSYLRNVNGDTPTLNCLETDLDYGGIKKYKIGLLTMDELSLAGLSAMDYNNTNYLFNESDFYTISPAAFNRKAFVGILDRNGKIDATQVNLSKGVRPVINISKQVETEGNGTIENPYLIKY